jgi:hypothetical protein
MVFCYETAVNKYESSEKYLEGNCCFKMKKPGSYKDVSTDKCDFSSCAVWQ